MSLGFLQSSEDVLQDRMFVCFVWWKNAEDIEGQNLDMFRYPTLLEGNFDPHILHIFSPNETTKESSSSNSKRIVRY